MCLREIFFNLLSTGTALPLPYPKQIDVRVSALEGVLFEFSYTEVETSRCVMCQFSSLTVSVQFIADKDILHTPKLYNNITFHEAINVAVDLRPSKHVLALVQRL
jgi:hypothetical protein